MDRKELFYRTLEQATSVFEHLSPKDYPKQTPDTEWDVAALANHMLYELSWVPDMVEGHTIDEAGTKFNGDLIAEDPVGNWRASADRARAAVSLCELDQTAHLSFADVPNENYIQQVSGDLLIHSWDLAAALGLDWRMDPELAQIIYDGMAASRSSWQESGLFGKEITVPEDADIQTKLLALVGRDGSWQPKAPL